MATYTRDSSKDITQTTVIDNHDANTVYVTDDGLFLGSIEVSNISSVRNIGEIVSSSLPLTDAGLHLLDGSLILGGGIYQEFVDYIADLHNSGTSPAVFATEADWQTLVNTYGVCGKFVYDSVANTVRLPKITGILEGTTDVTALGDLVEAGLPMSWFEHKHTRGDMDIWGQFDYHVWGAGASGAFYANGKSANKAGAGSDGHCPYTITGFNASRYWTGSTSTPNYTDSSHNNSTVQPQTIKCYYYIVIATKAKTDIEVDIDEIATDINGKADLDLSNVPTSRAILEESYVNGTSWYRVYSDGWCEQGGQVSINTNTTITLLKPYKDTNYNLLNTINNDYQSNSNPCTWSSASAYRVSASQIRLNYSSGGNGRTWQACGYIR